MKVKYHKIYLSLLMVVWATVFAGCKDDDNDRENQNEHPGVRQ